jgi:Kef-type K+ transport system membrane component KefB
MVYDTLNHPILLVLMIAVLAPLVGEVPIGLRIPTVVVEMALGIVVGPHVLGWVPAAALAPEQPVMGLGQAGLAFLFFLVGMDIDLARFRGRPLSLAVISWCLSLLVAIVVVTLLYGTSLVRAPVMVAIALTTTATGMLVPILRDGKELDTKFGIYLMGAAMIGEFGPIIVIALIFTRVHSYPAQVMLMLFFIAVAMTMAVAALRVRPLRVLRLFHRTLHASSQLPVRICMLVLSFLMVLAGAFGLDAILGAFAAGMVVGLAARGKDGDLLHEKLDAIAFGYFVPFFFVTSGMQFDLGALYRSKESMLLTPLFLLLFIVVRGAPVFLYRRELAPAERVPFVLYLATALPLVVAIVSIGQRTGLMRNQVAAALTGAAMLSALLFPMAADALLVRWPANAERHRAQGA